MKTGELCAGYNGLGMAVEEVFGATPAWFSEFDAAPSRILAHHYPGVPNYGDMTRIDWVAIEPADIISGGTPCQDLSAAGRRAGMTEGTRSNLWVQMREAIAIQRPKYVVWENVRGAYSATAASDLEQCPGCMGDAADGGAVLRALGRVLGDLSDLGYDTQWRGLRAADVGACHGRFRVFVLARNAQGDNERDDAKPGRRGAGRAQQQAGGTSSPAQNANLSARGERRLTTPGQAEGGRPWADAGGRGGAPSADASSQGLAISGLGRIASRQDSSSATLGDHSPSAVWGEYGPAIHRWESVMGRRAPAAVERSGRNGSERLSPKFCEWMMGLPNGWVTDPAIGISRNEQLKACGNGVVPQQAIAALRDMLNAFSRLEAA